jgi:hypothetical protein
MITAEDAQASIDRCECPYCNDGKTYRALALHIYHAHGITAYKFRQQFGWNRHHPLSSAEYRYLRHQISKGNYKDKKGFVEYDQREAVRYRYLDGGKRNEAKEADCRASSDPKRVTAFLERCSKLDYSAIARRAPQETRIARSKKAADALWAKRDARQRSEYMKPIRAQMTAECIKRRTRNAQETFTKKYRGNPDWVSQWHKKVTQGIRDKRAKVPHCEWPTIVAAYEAGRTQVDIATDYGVTSGAVWWIIKKARAEASSQLEVKW